MLFFHYQERYTLTDGFHRIISDVVLSQDELEQMYDEFQLESLLNSLGDWGDNGVVYIKPDGSVANRPWEEDATEYPLENRIKRILAEANTSDYCKENKVTLSDWNGVHPVGQT